MISNYQKSKQSYEYIFYLQIFHLNYLLLASCIRSFNEIANKIKILPRINCKVITSLNINIPIIAAKITSSSPIKAPTLGSKYLNPATTVKFAIK